MSGSPEMWIAINTIGLLGIGLLTLWNNRHIKEVKKIVDGPLTVALESNKELARKVADQTMDRSDERAALKAEIIAENRKAGKEAPPIPPI